MGLERYAKIKSLGEGAQGNVFLAKDIPIPAASSFEYMGGNKIVMETGHSLILQSDTANSLDTVASIMEIT